MYENCEVLKKYIDMIDKTTCKEEALDVVVKIILDATDSEEMQEVAFKYVNERFEHAAIQDTSIHA